mmetsp:Transcript_95028/g.188259  ORF Transcript_95028/g.188259 Transcript_95028/m.188259 type:complete len:305 (+) Transcript_95028:16-930(+)
MALQVGVSCPVRVCIGSVNQFVRPWGILKSQVQALPRSSGTSPKQCRLAQLFVGVCVVFRQGRKTRHGIMASCSPISRQEETACSLIDGILQNVCETGQVPVRNQPMEYSPEPKVSPVGKAFAGSLVKELLEHGLHPDRAEVGAAVLCLMLGGVDEAHNLVTPHSWPAPTSFGGPPRRGSEVRQEAAYCHVIVHRMEGENVGEFGTGFNNSNYWIGNAFGSKSHEIFPELKQRAAEVFTGCAEAESALRSMSCDWDPRVFNRLCAKALRSGNQALLDSCSAMQAHELRLLFNHVTGAVEKTRAA